MSDPGSTGPTIIHIASGREWRGGQRQVCYLAEALARRSVPQLVVTGRASRLAGELVRLGIAVRDVGWSAALDPRAAWGVLGAVRARRRSRPVLHAHDPHALVLGAVAAARYRLPLVVTRRVDFPLRRPFLWRRARRVIAISQAVARVLETSGIPASRLVVVPSGIPLDGPGPVPVDLRSRLGLGSGTRLAVSVGALVAHKDYPTLIGAAAALRERAPALHWVIAGDGPERPRLSQLAARLGVTDRVHLIGQVEDGRAVIAAADLFVASSREEGLNTSVLDAMRLGIPVVSTDAGGLPEALGDAGVVVRREDPGSLAAGVEALLGSPGRRAVLAAAGARRVQRFSSARMAEGMLAVYHSVAPDT